jgi:integrase
LRLHVDPAIGDRRLDDIRPADIVNLCWDLYAGLSANTVTKNIKGYINSVFTHAVFEEACEFNPCASIPHGKLPKPGRNPWPPFERHEVEQLLTDPRIPPDRRMTYGLAFFLMERCGEVCGIRFSDWDRSLKPFSGVTIDSQYQDQPLKGSRDDYVAVRRVPVHPTFEPMLARWKASGFAETFGRPPRDDDFIVPRLAPHTRQARSRLQVWKALEADMALIGIKKLDGRATHGFRKAFITLACNDDGAGMAPENVIKALSHTSQTREAFESYRRWEWGTYCEAVRCVQLDLSEPSRVLSIVP